MSLVFILLLLFINSSNLNRSLILIIILLISLKKMNFNFKEKFINLENLIDNKDVQEIMTKCCTEKEIILIKSRLKCMIKHPKIMELMIKNINHIMPTNTKDFNKLLGNIHL